MHSQAVAPFEELVARTAGLQPWRRLFHVVGGAGVAGIVHYLSPHAASTRWLFGGALALTFLADMLRLRSETLNRWFFSTFRTLVCPREVEHLSLTWFLLGVFVVLWLPEPTAVPAILVLALADPAASVIGRVWGRRRLGKGTAEGTAAFFVTAVVVLVPFVGVAPSIGVAAVAAAVEVLPTGVDDNLLIPAVTAGCIGAALAL